MAFICLMQEKICSKQINKGQMLVRNIMSEYTKFVEQPYPVEQRLLGLQNTT
jgi:hypothetical protein